MFVMYDARVPLQPNGFVDFSGCLYSVIFWLLTNISGR
jgi:hypothetical protein